MSETKMMIAAYGFRVWTNAFIKMAREGRLEELRTMGMDHINGFIVILNEGLRLAQNAGLHPEPIDEPIMLPADVIINKPEVDDGEDD